MSQDEPAAPGARERQPRMPFICREEELRVTGLAQRYGYDNAEHLCSDWLEDLHEIATGYRPPAVAARPWQQPLRAWLEERARYPGNNATIVAKRGTMGMAPAAPMAVPVTIQLDPAQAQAITRLAAARGTTPEALLTRLLQDLALVARSSRPPTGSLAHLVAWVAAAQPGVAGDGR